MITTPQDYIGKYSLSTGMFSTSKLQEYIDRYEPRYLKELFGVDLYDQFVSDLSGGVPQSPNFLKVFNAFSENVGGYYYTYNRHYQYTELLDSEGIKEMLKGFIYFEYAKDLKNQMTPYGNVTQNAENSDITNTLFSLMYTRYNEAIRSFDSIQQYILLNQNVPTGQLVTITMVQPGTNVPVPGDEYPVVGGTGTDATFIVTTTPMGTIDSVTIGEPGKDYSVNDQLSIDAGNDDLIVNADFVGTGDYKLFKGKRKLSVYWI
jgi:hypothetical protein